MDNVLFFKSKPSNDRLKETEEMLARIEYYTEQIRLHIPTGSDDLHVMKSVIHRLKMITGKLLNV